MMCQRIGLPPISTIGFGRMCDSSLILVPRPPARITTFINVLLELLDRRGRRFLRTAAQAASPGCDHLPQQESGERIPREQPQYTVRMKAAGQDFAFRINA